MKNIIASIIALGGMSSVCFAADGYVPGPLSIDTLSVINEAVGAQQAGNMEVKFKTAFVLPPGVVCDQFYVTTKKVNDPDRAMLSLLRDAKTQAKTVSIWVTDAAIDNAFPGRCALKLVIVN